MSKPVGQLGNVRIRRRSPGNAVPTHDTYQWSLQIHQELPKRVCDACVMFGLGSSDVDRRRNGATIRDVLPKDREVLGEGVAHLVPGIKAGQQIIGRIEVLSVRSLSFVEIQSSAGGSRDRSLLTGRPRKLGAHSQKYSR
ncbi:MULTISPECIES: hypothetical protein [unclassified Bradyrhizobium]|uniref:hypothetical protein n=1 Tax=Bradyrhizobium sp. USDA 4541 TaxID=2817704 RepID=UPI0020A39E0E|nr:hypothetical protein [Bradyrhizobium sp. USDA 4541]MCP1850263.1 hypothetical protein [Bradyrhizobium sp. USDA 4541]